MKTQLSLFALVASGASLLAQPTEFETFYGDSFEPIALAAATKTESAMTIDGNADEAVWSAATSYSLDYTTWPPPDGHPFGEPLNSSPFEPASDLSATFKLAWDETNLYILVEVTDDVPGLVDRDSNFPENDDSVEIYLDGDNTRDPAGAWNDPGYDFINDRQIKIRATNDAVAVGGLYDPTEEGTVAIDQDITTVSAYSETNEGYNMEIQMDWNGIFRDFFGDGTLVQQPEENAYFGFDLKVSDDDDGGEREVAIGWAGDSNDSYADPTVFGTAWLAPAEGGGGDDSNLIADALNAGTDPLYVQFDDTLEVLAPQLWYHYHLKAIYDFGDNSGIVFVREMGSFVYMALDSGDSDGHWAYAYDIDGGTWVYLSYKDMTRLDPPEVDRIEGWVYVAGSVNDWARIAEFDDDAEPGTYIFNDSDVNIRLTTEP